VTRRVLEQFCCRLKSFVLWHLGCLKVFYMCQRLQFASQLGFLFKNSAQTPKKEAALLTNAHSKNCLSKLSVCLYLPSSWRVIQLSLSQPKSPPWEMTSRLAPSSKGYAPRNPSQPQEPIPYNGAPSPVTDVPKPVTSPRLVVCWAFIRISVWVNFRDGRTEKITHREASTL
jgi:hypothetical protein